MSTPFSSTHRFWKPKIVLSVLALILCAGLAAATVFTMYYANFTATVKAPDVRLVAGNDNIGGTVYPTASITVASTYDYATVGFSMFPSATNSPQPATYYTNPLNITNVGSSSHTIQAITVTSVTDASSSLGNITIYYFATQTDTPETATPLGVASITDTTVPVSIFTGTQTIAAGATQYIEIVAYAAEDASVDATVTFTVSIQWV
ncbi:MAG: hypothetical protein ACQCN5_05185 [Candidatus Bathyarchaeia archaeon]|jgi:hypothetical protein